MNMKRLVLSTLLCLLAGIMQVYAQKTDYAAAWKKIETLIEKEGKPQSALTEVKKIYTAAKTEKNDAQYIKALVYMAMLQDNTRENNLPLSIKEIETEITQATEPSRSILKSFLAGKYLQFFQQNRYKFYNRTQTVSFVKDDINTWSAEDLHNRIGKLYLGSIANKTLLKQTRLESFEPVIIKGNARNLRPTLFDLLAHQALSYFKNDERNIKKPSYAFEIDQAEAFSPAKSFAAFQFVTRDSLSLHHKALLVYQELIAFHLSGNNTEALLDVDLDRLLFAYLHSTHENKNELYRKALEQVISTNKSSRSSYQAQYMLATYYNNLATQYHPERDTQYRFERIKAVAILEKIVSDSAQKNYGWTNSYNLLQILKEPNFSFTLEKVNLPSKPFRSLISFKNFNKIYFRLIRVNSQLKMSLNRGMDEKYWNEIVKTAPVRAWEQNLPLANDLQQHSTEIKIDGLPTGEYILLGSATKEFKLNKSLLGAQAFNVSNISYINNDNIFFVLHRETGIPLKNAKATVYTRIYNYKENRYSRQKLGSYVVNEKGFFEVAKDEKKQQPYLVDIILGEDTLALDESYYDYGYYGEDRNEKFTRIFYFTDRSIYRPGQQVEFKGIAFNKSDDNKIAVNYGTTIYLRDANYQVVDSIRVNTNEYGSFSGKFQLPQNVLTGMFHLVDKESRNSTSFSVEEYKRPKFFIEYEKIKESYKVGQTVNVSGTAKAYAGNTISEAKVVYRVVRTARFPWYPRRIWLPPSSPMEIAHGETTTDKDGKFKISFTAIPDRKINLALDPLFDYIVYADVTDMNGETRSGQKRITAGYKSLLIRTDIPGLINKDSIKAITIWTENLNGEFQPSMVTVKFTKLIPENRLIRNRYWSQPDTFVMSKEEFISYFPNDEYADESNPVNWKKGEVIYSSTDSSRADGKWQLMNAGIPAGHYEIEITTKDKEGKEVKNVQVTEVFDNNVIDPSGKQYFIFRPAQGSIEPGETIPAFVGSSTNVFLVRHIDKQKEGAVKINASDLDTHTIPTGIQKFQYSASEKDRGGYGVHYFMVRDNRIYQASDIIRVPWTNKQLEISYASFRDKTLPGSNEKWKLTIKGNKNEKITTELLASMYDASLDQFQPHAWAIPSVWANYHARYNWNGRTNFTYVVSQTFWNQAPDTKEFVKKYDRFIFNQDHGQYLSRRSNGKGYDEVVVMAAPPNMGNVSEQRKMGLPRLEMQESDAGAMLDTVAQTSVDDPSKVVDYVITRRPNEPALNPQNLQVRVNFNETAFFFPHLKTDADGNIEIEFTIPEALTRWKFQAFAHSKELAMGMSTKEIVTQKELMVQTNAPRFIRQGDRIEFSTKIANLSDKEITGKVELQLFNSVTSQPVDGRFMNSRANQYFTVAAGGSEAVSFPMQVPFDFNEPLTWRIIASGGNYSDGEENILPVLTNKVLVTETLPLNMKGEGKKDFSFDKLKNSGTSSTLQHHALTVEYTANPAWFAVQALPYLNDYPYDCAEQVWNRYYANALASKIANASPKLKMIFEKWKNTDTAALISNLQKNQELKNVLLEETPWVMAAKNETEQKRNIALLFDMIRMSNELKANLEKLKTMQSPNGGFVWFKGGPDDRYITQYIMTGIGHLARLGVDISPLQSIINNALPYLDRKIKEDHDALIKSKADRSKQQPGYTQIHYLYMRSFFKKEIPSATKAAFNYYRDQSKKFWLNQNRYMQGMIALFLFRNGDAGTPGRILASLKETSILDPEMGRYWKEVRYGYSWFWWHAPIETQSLLIEAFAEISKDIPTVDDMKTWLIKNKQTTNWRTTKATADACYAMLLQGSNWLQAEPTVSISMGSATFSSEQQNTEAGTGYFQQKIEKEKIQPSMGTISVTVKDPKENSTTTSSMPSWGAVYWQYFEDMDKVQAASTPLKLEKKLFLRTNSDRGPILTPVTTSTELKPGDKITVRMELRVDRDMEYVHMKDMRASALEPVNVISGYKWQGGLGYYESTRDASTNFFFSYLPKGTYVFEYSLFVSHKGSFSNGITTIQSLYAPEFSAHSEGVSIRVD